jgi:hypothetical protein
LRKPIDRRQATMGEARRIAVNIAKLLELLKSYPMVFPVAFLGGVPVTIHQKPAADYFMIVTRKGQQRLWRWQIQQRPPTGIRIYGEGFKSELAARLAGAKALRALLTAKQ